MNQNKTNKLLHLRELRERISCGRIAAASYAQQKAIDDLERAKKAVLNEQQLAKKKFDKAMQDAADVVDPVAQYVGVLLERQRSRDRVTQKRQARARRKYQLESANNTRLEAHAEFCKHHRQRQCFEALQEKVLLNERAAQALAAEDILAEHFTGHGLES